MDPKLTTGLPAVLCDLPANAVELEELAPLAEALAYRFARPELLRVALTTASWANEHRNAGWPDNACLEFFGDAVVDLCAADAIWRRFPALDEGALTRLRALIVSERALAEIARELDLGRWLFIGRGDAQCGGRERASTLADTVEAVIGAVYLDARSARVDPGAVSLGVFERLWARRLQSLEAEDGLDPKSRLQQRIQAALRATPYYEGEVVGDPSSGQLLSWQARVLVDGGEGPCILGQGTGPSLRAAERAAARDALSRDVITRTRE